jgi:hypothetical protein
LSNAAATAPLHLKPFIRQHLLTGLLALVIAIAVRVVVALWVYGIETNDTHYFRAVADVVLAGGSPYDLPWDYANYPPFWSYLIPSAFRVWGFLLNVSFDFMIKLFPIAVDGLVSALLYVLLVEKTQNTRQAFLWCMAYALNPLSIYNNAYAGQVDSLPIGVAFFAAVMIMRPGKWWLPLGALTLGVAMSFKALPVIFFPFWLWETYRRYGWNWRWLATITGFIFLPFIAQFLPFIVLGQFLPLARMVEYMFLQSGGGGLGILGWLGILKWLGMPVAKLTVETLVLPLHWGAIGGMLVYILDAYRLLLISKMTFGVLYLVVLAKGRQLEIPLAILIIFLLVFVVIGGYFGHYFMWLLPFAIWLRSKFIIPYTAFGIALTVTLNPILNLAMWSTCLLWLINCLMSTGWLARFRVPQAKLI